MNDVPRDGEGHYLPRIHNTKKLKELVCKWMDEGVDDTEIAKRLMWDNEVKVYYAVKLIQGCKKERDEDIPTKV